MYYDPTAISLVSIGFLVLVDQATKAAVLRWKRGASANSRIRIRLIVNDFRGAGSVAPLVLILLWMVVPATLFSLISQSPLSGDKLVHAGCGIALGGASGNLLDRLFRGHVIDFIELGSWPVFNLADVGIVSGTLLVLIQVLIRTV